MTVFTSGRERGRQSRQLHLLRHHRDDRKAGISRNPAGEAGISLPALIDCFSLAALY
jgi:hypothetical protein